MMKQAIQAMNWTNQRSRGFRPADRPAVPAADQLQVQETFS
jgi:hypothetical protein